MCISTEINFGKLKDKSLSTDDIDNLICEFISQLQRRGQVGGTEYNWSKIKGEIRSFVQMAHPKALSEQHHSKWNKETIKKLENAFGAKPQWNIVDDDIPSKFQRLTSVKRLVLFTTMFEYINCIYDMDSKKMFPLYQLSLTDEQIEDINRWISAYKLHDQMWLLSGKLEILAYKQWVEAHSELNKHGRELSALTEEATGIPTYYHLMRYWGSKEDEDKRKCPGCHKKWRNKSVGMGEESFLEFPYICDKCRLVSYYPFSFDNQRYAKIGE
ncbi:MAG: DUF2310 family Zn-ribbon-containing protein [Candidatus Omnitrophica bacterium]|nr:DUF2310 family Zn-ribbon-containing protein [Candidatus Omnitrophota bacterium]